MPRALGRNLHGCFTITKRPLPPDHQSPTSTTFLCPEDRSHPNLIKSYNSLYDCPPQEIESTSKSYLTQASYLSSSSSSSSFSSSDPDFATVYASQRFFFSSPGRSNSIIESTPSITSTSSEPNSDRKHVIICSKCSTADPAEPDHHPHPDDGNNTSHQTEEEQEEESPTSSCSQSSSTVKDSVAVPTYSPDPYTDFRRSMQEMVEARGGLVDVKANWDYLHELLLCYLALNPKSTHKFIVCAFADLLVNLLSTETGGRRENGFAADGCETRRQCM